MKNFLLISPNFPTNYDKFAFYLKEAGFNVLAIGDTPYDLITNKLRSSVSDYFYLNNLSNYEDKYRAVAFLIYKHGKIDFLESNNEHWLEDDARLREEFNINGVKPEELCKYKHKSLMKKYYNDGNVKTSPYLLIDTSVTFKDVSKLGLPLFIKPNIGVGAIDTHKVSNIADYCDFLKEADPNLTYIAEPYIDGDLFSFDALVDKNGQVIFYAQNVFPVSNYLISKGLVDDYYYVDTNVDEKLKEVGIATTKAFSIRGRFVHLEYFKLKQDTAYGKKGDYIGLEVNARPAGGFIPEMISDATGVNYHRAYALMMNDFSLPVSEGKESFVIQVSRRFKNDNNYINSTSDILTRYNDNITASGIYPSVIAKGMGDYYFVGKFEDKITGLAFKDFCLEVK